MVINICLEGFNRYELCAFVDTGCSVCFGKKALFPEFIWQKSRRPIQVRLVDDSIMVHSELASDVPIMIGGVQCVIPTLWATNQPSHDMFIGNNFQRLHVPVTQHLDMM